MPIQPTLHRLQSAASVYPAINTRQRAAEGESVAGGQRGIREQAKNAGPQKNDSGVGGGERKLAVAEGVDGEV